MLAPDDPHASSVLVGRKSGDANLHWMEALAELAEATGDADVQRSLHEVVDSSTRHLLPGDAARAGMLPARLDPDPAVPNVWRYGHNVEFASLLLRARRRHAHTGSTTAAAVSTGRMWSRRPPTRPRRCGGSRPRCWRR